MMRLAVAAVLANRHFGCLWTGIADSGERRRVSSYEPIWPVVGEVYEVEGEEATYIDRWGHKHLQINNGRMTRIRASGRLLLPWLMQLPGVGHTRAARLMEHFGINLLESLGDPARAIEVAAALDPARPALAARLACAVQAAYANYADDERDGLSEARFYVLLEANGVDDRLAARLLWRLLGNNAWDRLVERPYTAAVVMPWTHADHLGQRLLAARGERDVERHPDRYAGACDSVVRDLLQQGDTAMRPDEFKLRLARKGVPRGAAFEVGLQRRRVLAFQDVLLAPGAAALEGDVHFHLRRLQSATPPCSIAIDERASEAVAEAERTIGVILTDEQRMSVRLLLQQRVGLLQGGAGTGKTTSMRVFVAAWRLLHGRVEAAALSGKAALKLAEGAGLDAITIAQLLARTALRAALEADGTISATEDYLRSKAAKVTLRLPRFSPGTVLLLDEASMIDIANLRRLLQLLPDGAGILLVGDVHQLPPIGIGQVFHDLVAARHGVVQLNTILRQENGNPLLEAAAAVRSGTVPVLPAFQGAGQGAYLEDCDLMDVASRLSAVRQQLAQDSEVMVICARRTTVRAVCRAEMARRQGEGASGVPLGPLCAWIAIGDPVVMAANHYKHGLANGQLGRITGLDPVEVLWEGADQPLEVADDYCADVVSAWAVTCHKSQGSETQRVVIGLDSQRMLTRQWLYTAITRAREQAVLVGPAALLELAVRQLSTRTTLLSRLASPLSDVQPVP